VVIVGAGPSGLMLACELGLAGVHVIVLERRPAPDDRSPGMAINMCSAELLDQRGLLDPLRSGTFPLPAAHFSLFWMDLDALDRPHEDSIAVPQSRVERLLEDRAAALGADVRRGHEVAGIEQLTDGVAVSVRSGPTGYRITCDYLVGCDGEDSTVRKLAGIGFPGSAEPGFSGIIGDVEMDMSDLADGQLGAFYYPVGGIYTAGPLEPGALRVSTVELGAAPPDRHVPVTLDELRETIRRVTGTDLKAARARWLSRWSDCDGHADRYRDGRVFLAGDAAHVYFPLGGLRLNTAMHDAVNLGWKLAAQLQGWASAGLLDTYEAERYPVNRQAQVNAQAQLALMHPPRQVAPLREVFGELLGFREVSRHLTEVVTGLDVCYAMGPGGPEHPLLGRRLPPVPLATRRGPASTAQIMHAGRGVLLDLREGRCGLGDVSGWADRVDVVTAGPSPDIDAAAVLIRPDGHVAWAAPDADVAPDQAEGLRAALARWFGAPGGS
jgi:2-polyprenyl-6-methoxyphenol hydroxylase-like FAD-dependent oxidoreductase